MQSIIQHDEGCFLCGDRRNLERHHCLHGTANRQLAEEDGLWVWLCPRCHRGTFGVHGKEGSGIDKTLKQIAEQRWLHHSKKTVDDFIKRYGRNYLN